MAREPNEAALEAFEALCSDVKQFDDHAPDGSSGLFSDKVPLFMKSYLVNWLRRFVEEHGDAVTTALKSSQGQPPAVDWQPIETAPRDGTPITAICGRLTFRWPMFDFTARWLDGRWCAQFDNDGNDWRPISPAPDYWKPKAA